MQINQFGECLQRQQLLFDEFASTLLTSIPHNELRLNAPKFFHTHADTTNMDEGIRPITYEEFREKAPTQMHLFYSQGRARYGVYKQSKLKFYSKHIPHEQYRERKCQICLFYGHRQWDCPEYVCPRCKRNCGHRKEECAAPRKNFNMVVMMANTPELTPEPQDFPPVASTSLLEPTSNVSEGAPLTVVPVINAEEIIYTNIGIFEQFIREYDQQAPPVMPVPVNLEIQAVISRSPRIVEQFIRDHGQLSTLLSRRATPTQSELDLDEKNYKLVLALEHMQ